MKFPRDLDGKKLATLLRPYGYQITRQTGSHLRLTSTATGVEHHLTIPQHDFLKVGTLESILNDLAAYLGLTREDLLAQLMA